MTDIDAIRKRASERVNTVLASQDRRALLAAYDAKCEELAEMRKRMRDAIELDTDRIVRLARKLAETCAERDAAVRERDGLALVVKTAADLLGSVRPIDIHAADVRDKVGAAFVHLRTALAPPTEQTKVEASEREEIHHTNQDQS